jgi:hypothetical protein|uniref:DUF6644 family protein n=1 Tax=Altererythrobacter segetis TaxID=1104773 RepID=UPI00140B36BF|nr:DUF6644 family protein [Altererythrobacter segetis]
MYPTPTNIWERIEFSSLGTTIAESTWMFPTLETLHVIALVSVLGTIFVVDLRMLGWTSNKFAVTAVAKDTLPWTWGAFVLAAITGGLLFISKASSYVGNPYFLWKMGMMALAGLNMMYFHFMTWRTVEHWDRDASMPVAVKVAAALSIVFWLAVVFFGRAIGFTLGIFGS